MYRLAVGKHVLKVSEAIDYDRFTGWENTRRGQLFRHERYKYLELDVKPNTTYRLGVKFFRDKKQDIRAQRYWEPVVWEEVEETCRG